MHLAFTIENSEFDPALGFYQFRSEGFNLPDLSYPQLAQIQGIRYPVAIGGSAENANASIALDNGDGSLTELFSLPPLARSATIHAIINNDALTLFSGVIVAIAVGAIIRISVES